jgi:hypothetical protein
MQRGWRSIARELGCNPADLAERWWAGAEAELELAGLARRVVRSDPACGRLRPHPTRAGPDPAGDDQGVPEPDGGLP